MPRDQLLAGLLRRVAVLVTVASVATSVILVGFTLWAGGTVLRSTRVTLAALASIEETVGVVDSVSASLESGVSSAARSVETASGSSGELVGILDEVADLASTDLPASVEAIDASMGPLIEAGAVIDRTLRALALVGVPYSPEVPFDEALRDVDESLDGLPDRIRSQGTTLAALIPTIETIGADLDRLGDELESMEADLASTSEIMGRYRNTATEARAVIQGAESVIGPGRWIAVAGLVAAGVLWVAIGIGLWRMANLIDPERPESLRV